MPPARQEGNGWAAAEAVVVIVVHTLAVAIKIKLINHSRKLLIRQVLPQLLRNAAQIFQADFPRAIVVKQSESFLDLFRWITFDDFLFHCVAVMMMG